MGLERIAAVLQGKHDNYDIDLFRALILASAEASGVAPDGPHAVSHRVIADHLRASAFLIADGVLPSKEGRGYVLRRIMRRAMRHAHMLGCKEPLMWRLVPALVQQMGAAYPELLRAQPLITETLRLEETNFKQTLERGLAPARRGDRAARPGRGLARRGRLPALRHLRLSARPDRGRAARRRAARSRSRASTTAMARQREEARKSWVGSGEAATEAVWFALREEVGATEFLGYETETAEGVVLAIMRGGERVAEAAAGDEIAVIVNQTPFYAESGGQVGDTGAIFSAARRRARGARHGEEGRRSARPSRHRDARRAEDRRRGRAAGSTASAAGGCAPTIRSRICCIRRCAAASASMSRKRARSSRPTGCASISAIRGR